MVDPMNSTRPDGEIKITLADLPAFGVCGWSGSGKITLIERVVPHLRKKGLKVAVIKRTTHSLEVDRPGKDSDRFFRSGADVILKGPKEGLLWLQDPAPDSFAATLWSLCDRYDLVLVEGYRDSPLPKVWLLDSSENTAPGKVQGVVATLAHDADRVKPVLAILEKWLPLQWRKTPVLGCLLIGGKSRRMGYPKHLIQRNGKTWTQRTAELLEPVTSHVVLVGGKPPRGMTDCVHLMDVPDARGPMAGVLAAMRWAPRVSWLVAACDLPLLSLPALEWLLSTRSPGVWATLPRLKGQGRWIEPLLAHYDYRARPLLENLAAEGHFSLSHLGTQDKMISPSPPTALAPAWKDVDTPAQLDQVG